VLGSGRASVTPRTRVTVTVAPPPPPTVHFSIKACPIVPGKPLGFMLEWTIDPLETFQITADDGPSGEERLPVPVKSPGSFRVEPRKLNVTYVSELLPTASVLTEKEESNDKSY